MILLLPTTVLSIVMYDRNTIPRCDSAHLLPALCSVFSDITSVPLFHYFPFILLVNIIKIVTNINVGTMFTCIVNTGYESKSSAKINQSFEGESISYLEKSMLHIVLIIINFMLHMSYVGRIYNKLMHVYIHSVYCHFLSMGEGSPLLNIYQQTTDKSD